MKSKWTVGGAFCAGVFVLCGGSALSQDQTKKTADDPGAEWMEVWMEAGTPGEHHKHLQPMVGKWNAQVKWRMDANAPWSTSTTTSVVAWILGGRYLQEKVSGEIDGAPFEGLGMIGYDNVKKKHFSTWMDNLSTGIAHDEGQCNESGSVITLHGSMTDPMGQLIKSRTVVKIINNDKRTTEMFQSVNGGAEFSAMEIICTRIN